MVTGLLMLMVKLLVLAALYFGVEWLIGSYSQPIGKIWAAILIIIGVVFVLQWLGIA
jgi:hypothetical protein